MFNKHLLAVIAILSMGIGLQNNVYANEENVMSDTVITTKIKAAMATDKIVSASDVKVETTNGIVKLSGDVKSKAEADAAINIASTTEGVVDIDASHLLVQGGSQPFTDAIITAKIKALFAKEKVFGDNPIAVTSIHVETNDGQVMLTGDVDTQAQATNAQALAEKIKSVRKVQSNLVVKQR